jgi:hypothetical protein
MGWGQLCAGCERCTFRATRKRKHSRRRWLIEAIMLPGSPARASHHLTRLMAIRAA